ncbi:MAG: 50S ribosomal protein L13 [Candidatus Nanohaloarchaea archaeon]
MTVLDAGNKIVGRLATEVARRVKEGEQIDIVNSEKAVISGEREEVVADYRQKYERGSKYTGPHYPKRPDRILKRIVKGMLPDDQELKSNVKTYLGNPEGEAENPGTKEGSDLRTKNYVKLGEVSKSLGWSPEIEV